MTNTERMGVWISPTGEIGSPDWSNLFRYCGNNPTNAIDPSGLEEVLMMTGKTYELSWAGEAAVIISRKGSRAIILDNCEVIDPSKLPDPPAKYKPSKVLSGNWKAMLKDVPEWVVGPSGCGPCVGLILIPPTRKGDDPFRPIVAAHFSATDSPSTTLDKLGHISDVKKERRFEGYTAVICGGIETDDHGYTNRLLANVITTCNASGLRGGKETFKYVAGSGVFVDSSGRLYCAPAEKMPGFFEKYKP